MQIVAATPIAPVAPVAPAVDESRERSLIDWFNTQTPSSSSKADSAQSFTSGELIFDFVRSRSGVDPNPPVTADAFALEGGLPGVGGLFAMMDMLIDAGVDTAGVSINEIRMGDREAICRLLESVKMWAGAGRGMAQ